MGNARLDIFPGDLPVFLEVDLVAAFGGGDSHFVFVGVVCKMLGYWVCML